MQVATIINRKHKDHITLSLINWPTRVKDKTLWSKNRKAPSLYLHCCISLKGSCLYYGILKTLFPFEFSFQSQIFSKDSNLARLPHCFLIDWNTPFIGESPSLSHHSTSTTPYNQLQTNAELLLHSDMHWYTDKSMQNIYVQHFLLLSSSFCTDLLLFFCINTKWQLLAIHF